MTDDEIDDERRAPDEGHIRVVTLIKTPIQGPEIHTDKGGDFTGRCYKCGSRNLWDDCTAYGCNDCGMLRCTG